MTTQAQIAANRRNSQQSTGPRTAEGKARVSRNAITHGLTCRDVLLQDEDSGQFDRYRDAMLADHQPIGAEEQDLVEHMVAAHWRLQRLWRAESDIYAATQDFLARGKGNTVPIGHCVLSDLSNLKGLTAVERREGTLTREYHRCSRRLQELQSLRRKGLRPAVEDEAISSDRVAGGQPQANDAAAQAPMAATASPDNQSGEPAKQSQSAPVSVAEASPGHHHSAAIDSTDWTIGKSAKQSQSGHAAEDAPPEGATPGVLRKAA